MSVPLTKEAAGESKKQITVATSQDRPALPIGYFASFSVIAAELNAAAVRAVTVAPGATALHRGLPFSLTAR